MIRDIKARLHELGCNEKLTGFNYAAEIIKIVAETNTEKTSICQLYRDVAANGSTGSRVERAIRTLVINAANVGNKAYIDKFANTLSPDRAQPTNMAFIYCLADEFKQSRTEAPEADQSEEPEAEPITDYANIVKNAFISEKISKLLEADNAKVERLIDKYPISIPVSVASDFMGCDVASTRAIIENGVIGIAWRKPGKANHGYYIPTAQFVRWYLKV